MIERVQLKNFTVFDELDLKVSPGINVFIGDNGTGKTHLLKVIYTGLSYRKENKRISDKIVGVFLPKEKRIGRLVKRTKGSSKANIKIIRNNKTLSLTFTNHTKESLKWNDGWKNERIGQSVYIPVKEMLANAPGFLSLYQKFDLHFEEVYADILHYAYAPPRRGPIGKERKQILSMIQKVIEGKVITKNEHFFLKNKQGELEFPLPLTLVKNQFE